MPPKGEAEAWLDRYQIECQKTLDSQRVRGTQAQPFCATASIAAIGHPSEGVILWGVRLSHDGRLTVRVMSHELN